MAAIIHGPGEGELHRLGPNEIAIKATAQDTGGALFLQETRLAPQTPGPPLHVHDELHDMFYVLEGELTFLLGEDGERAAPAGTFACIQPGTPHTFANRSDAPVRFLNLNVPGGFEEYMRELAAGEEPPATIMQRYDIRLVSP